MKTSSSAPSLKPRRTVLTGLVADGKLTQAQMVLMVDHMQTQVKTMVERTTVGPMQGRQGMGQMHAVWHRGEPTWAKGSGAARVPTNSPLLR